LFRYFSSQRNTLRQFVFLYCNISKISPEEKNDPANKFNLKEWKLQIPGPKDILNLENDSSQYFYLNKNTVMVFWVDCSEKGTTKNIVYVRSELRYLLNWKIDENCKRTAILRIILNLYPNKITI